MFSAYSWIFSCSSYSLLYLIHLPLKVPAIFLVCSVWMYPEIKFFTILEEAKVYIFFVLGAGIAAEIDVGFLG